MKLMHCKQSPACSLFGIEHANLKRNSMQRAGSKLATLPSSRDVARNFIGEDDNPEVVVKQCTDG